MAAKYVKSADGYFKARVWDGTYIGGKKHYKYLRSRKSSADLEKKVAEHNMNIRDRKFVKRSADTFLEYARQWEETYKADKSANTRFMYQNIINRHFSCISCSVSDITRSDYAHMMNRIPGSRTKQQASMVFKQVLKSAIHDKLLPPAALEDITEGYERFQHVAKEKRPLTDCEKKALASADLDPRDRAFLYLLFGTGMRRGECAALLRDDFDLQAGTVSISKALAYVEQDVILKDTKNHKHRIVPIPRDVLPYISEYVSGRAGEIFAMKNGGHLTKSSLDKMWRRIVKAMQDVSPEPIEGLTPHILRHNYCTELCYKIPAVSINDIAYLMGDSKEVVLSIYNHLNMNREAVAETVSRTLSLL